MLLVPDSFLSAWAEAVNQRLADVRVFGSHGAAEVELDVFAVDEGVFTGPGLDEPADPYARLEDLFADRHAVGGDHLDSEDY